MDYDLFIIIMLFILCSHYARVGQWQPLKLAAVFFLHVSIILWTDRALPSPPWGLGPTMQGREEPMRGSSRSQAVVLVVCET